jgi:NADPH2:quinone reductase
MRAVRIEEFGGPEALRVVELPKPVPGDDAVLIRVTGIGVNFADTHVRTDDYHVPTPLPHVPGIEVIGRTDTRARVLALIDRGGYAEYAVAPRARTFRVPDGVEDSVALALLVQGVTAHHLLNSCARVQRDEVVVVHAAAGGVGSLVIQLAKRLGARVIATASSERKRAMVRDLGADAAIDPEPNGLCRRIRAANDGKKVDVVLEMTGGQTFTESFQALARFGRVVAYGNASRELAQISNAAVQQHSRSVIGFWLVDCLQDAETLVGGPLGDLFTLVESGQIFPIIGGTYPLADAASAHRDLEARRTVGKLVLDPSRELQTSQHD